MYAELCRALCIAAYTEPSVYAELLFVTARPYESFGSASYKEEGKNVGRISGCKRLDDFAARFYLSFWILTQKARGGNDLNAIVNIDEL